MLNRTQKIILSVGILLLICSGLFLPYKSEYLTEGDNPSEFLGYFFITDKPTTKDSFESIFGITGHSTDLLPNKSKFRTHIDTSLVKVQIMVISLITIGLIFLFSEQRQSINNQ